MGTVVSIVLGLAAGSVARMVMPGPKAGGILVGMVLGVAGALIGAAA